MVKKLIYTFILINLLGVLKVNAQVLGTPLTSVDYVDGTNDSANAQLASWWDTEYYQAPFRIGYFTSATPEANKIAFYWGNSNLCNGQNLKISGQIGGLFNFFRDNSYSFNFINNNQNMTCSFEYQTESRVGFTCVGTGGGSLYVAVNQLSFTSRENYSIGIRRDFDLSCDVTNLQVMQQDIINTQNIINSQNSNTQNIISNNNQTSQNIINNQNQNTQDIINNQNQNTQQEIESQQVCNIIDKINITSQNKYLGSSGGIYDTSSPQFLGITDFIPISSDDVLTVLTGISYTSVARYCFYNINKSVISCDRNDSLSTGQIISIPNNSSFVRFTIGANTNQPQFKLCKNGNQALSDDINNLNDSITSESQPNTNQDINDMNDMVASDTPISDLITMPLTLINAYINGVNSSCSPVNLGNLYGTDLILPCINLEQRLGSNLWHIIDSFFSIFMCYNIGMLFVTAFDGITSLRDDFEGLYQPRHADTGYQPKHGG